jgi:hypothetical protein
VNEGIEANWPRTAKLFEAVSARAGRTSSAAAERMKTFGGPKGKIDLSE